jgi:hypothetical protein
MQSLPPFGGTREAHLVTVQLLVYWHDMDGLLTRACADASLVVRPALAGWAARASFRDA